MIQDSIQYYIKNKNIKETDISKLIVLEEVIQDKILNIESINKLSIAIMINSSNFLNFEYSKEVKTIEVSILIDGQIEYFTKNSEIKLFKFSMPKNILISFNNLELSSKLLSNEVYIYEAICRKLTDESFYISLLADFNIDIL